MKLNEKFEFTDIDKKLFNISDYQTPSIERASQEYKPRMLMSKDKYSNCYDFCLVAGKYYSNSKEPQSIIYIDDCKYFYTTDRYAINEYVIEKMEDYVTIDLNNFVREAYKNIKRPENEDDYVICVYGTTSSYSKENKEKVELTYIRIENMDEDADWDNFKEGNAISGWSHVYFDLEKALKGVLKMYKANIRKLNNYWDLAINDLKKYWDGKNSLKDRIRSKRPQATKVTEPTDEDWWNSLSSEEKANMLKKMRASGLGESRHLRGHMLKESEENQTMYMDDVNLKNLTMDGEIYDRWGWEDIKDALWHQVVDKDNIEDIVCTAFAENKHWKNPTDRGWFPILTKFSRSASKAYFALKNDNGRQSKDQVLVSWTPITKDGL